MGARFAKWRAVITIADGIPSLGCIEGNAHALARYAALCQEAGMVPVVEPEVLMDGKHNLEKCFEVTAEVLRAVSRAIQQPALKIWKGQPANAAAAQQALQHRVGCNSAARLGQYRAEMENNANSRAS